MLRGGLGRVEVNLLQLCSLYVVVVSVTGLIIGIIITIIPI